MAEEEAKPKLALQKDKDGAADGETSAPTGPVLPSFAPQQEAPSYVLYGILGILAVLMFGCLIFVQWIEWSEYDQSGLFPSFTKTPTQTANVTESTE